MNLFHFIFRRVYIRFDYLCLIFETLNIKITTLMLQKTFLARCDNRACLAKTNIMSGSPEAWLSNDILSKSNTFGLTFYNRQIKKFPTEKQNVSLKHILT